MYFILVSKYVIYNKVSVEIQLIQLMRRHFIQMFRKLNQLTVQLKDQYSFNIHSILIFQWISKNIQIQQVFKNQLIDWIHFQLFSMFHFKIIRISKLCHMKHFICRDSIHSIYQKTLFQMEYFHQLTLQLKKINDYSISIDFETTIQK